jgi:heat-inducible transcriptional repressor
MMLDERKAAVLCALVGEYIQTGQPVGSAHVARASELGVSSATVRNEMAVLEAEGFLVHPHTSAGRIPTDKGYRFYVDRLRTPPGPLAPVQKRRVDEFFAHAHGELEQRLVDTSRLLSNLTDYAAVVLSSPMEDRTVVRAVQLVGLGSEVALAVAVMSDGTVEKQPVEIGDDTPEERVAAASARLAAHVVGSSLADAPEVPTGGDEEIDRIVARALGALAGARAGEREGEHVYVGGASRMAATFEAVDTVRRVLTMLEQQYVMVGLVRDALAHDKLVSIGTEHGVESLSECSVVVAPYEVVGGPAGTIGVLGPTRMNYAQAMAAVSLVSRHLARHLKAG